MTTHTVTVKQRNARTVELTERLPRDVELDIRSAETVEVKERTAETVTLSARAARDVDVSERLAQTVSLDAKAASVVALKERVARVVAGELPQIEARKSVVMILLDDLGPDMLSIYDSSEGGNNQWAEGYNYPLTPNIDQIAAEGITYDWCYASPICSPTRAQILTGRYPHINDSHEGTGLGSILSKGVDFNLGGDTYPLPQVLSGQNSAITTSAIGKWHLAHEQADYRHPVDTIGFDEYHGLVGNPNVDNQNPVTLQYGDYFNYWQSDVDASEDSHVFRADTDFLSTQEYEDAERFLEAQTDQFFLQWWCHSPHFWMDPIPDDAGPGSVQLTTTFDYDDQEPTVTVDNYQDDTGIPGTVNAPWRRLNAHVEAIDTLIGLLRAAVPADLQSNVVWIVVGDNGTDSSVLTVRDDDFFGNGQEPPDVHDPLHAKATCYEQGIRVPLIVGGSPIGTAHQGTRCDSLIDVVDLYPTVLDIMSHGWQSYLSSQGALSQVDGLSFLQTLWGASGVRNYGTAHACLPLGATTDDEITYWRAAINKNRWKILIRRIGGVDQPDELFYLGGGVSHGYAEDPLEETDLFPQRKIDSNVGDEWQDLKNHLGYMLYDDWTGVVAPEPIP